MDFALSEDQRHWMDAATRFASETLNENLIEDDEHRRFRREAWQLAADFGIQGLPIPSEFGGRGQGLPETIAAMEGLGKGCRDNGLLFAMNASMWTNSIPILLYGSDTQKRLYLPGLSNGSIVGANGASEPEAGSDIFSMRTTARREGDAWLLNGTKTWVTSGPVADLFVCYASTDPSKGLLGITAFIVPKNAPGFRVVREIRKMGLRTVPMGELAFEECRIPLTNQLGREGRGAEVFNCSMEWERGAILACALGTMTRQLEECIAHVKTRKQFGRQIGKFQSVANRIVEMKLRIETSKPLVYKIGWLKKQGLDATVEGAMAKLYVSEAFVKNSLDAVQIFGASGYAVESGLERDLRDSVGSLIYSGTNDIQRNIIARALIR